MSTRALIDRTVARIFAGDRPSWRDLVPLADVTGADLHALCAAADGLRAAQVGEHVTYVVNRNINFTNVCVKKCGFCAFSRTARSGEGYFLDLAEIVRRAVEAQALGATEVCIQAGLAPGLDGMFYVEVVRAVKRAAPSLHVHAFSPEEVKYGAHRARLDVREYVSALREAGLGTLPGTSAEILDDAVRARLAPGRITSAEWLDVVRTAHTLGLRTTATMMYGHVETAGDVLRHLETLRDLQRDTGGFTEFVPLSFVHTDAPLFAAAPGVRPGPGGAEVLRTHALARLMLGADLPNLQVSWVKEGLRMAEVLLGCGVNDLGGTLMNESISTAAGSTHGQLATPSQLQRLARAAGRIPAERSTLYTILRAPADLAPSTSPLTVSVPASVSVSASDSDSVSVSDSVSECASGSDLVSASTTGPGPAALSPLDAVDPARFGTYAALTRDPRFAFSRDVIPIRRTKSAG